MEVHVWKSSQPVGKPKIGAWIETAAKLMEVRVGGT